MAKRPLFEDIKDFIKKQIDEKVYDVGDKIPTEMELAKTFNTSRQTVNKALRDLVLDDIIERFPRTGSFVKEKIAQSSILDLKNIADEVKERGNTYSGKLVSLNKIRANERIAKILYVVKGQELYISQMIHYENALPVRFDTRYINQNFLEVTPGQYLKQNCPVEKVRNTIEAVIVDSEIQEHLDISKSEPCLKISRVVTSKGKIASYSKLYYPSSRYKLTSTFSS